MSEEIKGREGLGSSACADTQPGSAGNVAHRHTPGPWKVFLVKDGPNKGQLLGVGQETGEGVADAYGGLWGSGGEKLANARLIAAAPDLLDAAKAAEFLLAALCVDRDTATRIKLRAAIAKAVSQ